jgi:type II secretory pathway predicted ATPase ExeA
MNGPTIPHQYKLRLQAHFALTGVPFRKNVRANQMFDSNAQRELGHALRLWTEVGGIALVTGPSGVGKSITLRRFALELDDTRFHILRFTQLPTTPTGFLRTLNRLLGLPMRRHLADLFDEAQTHLAGYAEAHGPRPLLILDDAEGMHPDTLDLLRRLTWWELDSDDRFNVLLVGTEALLRTLQLPTLESLRTRIAYAQQLRPFSLEDSRNYVRFHVEQAGGRADLLSDDAVRTLFTYSRGYPRQLNQLAVHALIQAVVQGRDTLDAAFMERVVTTHPLYATTEA